MWVAALISNGKLIERGLPRFNRHRPSFGDILQRQIDQFQRGLIGGKGSTGFDDFSDRAIERFDGIGRVDHLADLGRKVAVAITGDVDGDFPLLALEHFLAFAVARIARAAALGRMRFVVEVVG